MAGIDELIVSLSESMAPVKAAPNPYVLFIKWVAGSAVYIGMMLFYLGQRHDLAGKLESPLFLAEVATLGCLILTAGISATTLSFPDMYQKRWLVWTSLLPLLFFVGLLYVEWLSDSPAVPQPVHGIECLLCITLLSILPTGWMFYNLRRQTSAHYYLTGGIALLAANSMGCFALRLSEETDSISHLLTWHYLPMIGFGIIGLWLGRRFLKW